MAMYRILQIGLALLALIGTDVLAHGAHVRPPRPAPVQQSFATAAQIGQSR
jgi:hypothetical protein